VDFSVVRTRIKKRCVTNGLLARIAAILLIPLLYALSAGLTGRKTMAQNTRKVRSRLGLSVLVLACSGCVVPNPPVPTIWQRLGIPQADSAFRSGVLNRNGEFPQLEKKPPLLPISDPQNLASENPLLKNAAEIKKDKDLKPQKIKALKYLASVGCVCPSEKDKVEEALLQGLNDCDCEVRLAAMEAICAAIKSCGPCGINACGSSCCTEAIRKKLDEMANKTDDKGCFVEPSAQLRRMAAAVLAACPPEEKKPSPEKSIKGEGDEEKSEDDAEPSPSDAADDAAEYESEPVRVKVSSADYGDLEVAPVVYQTPVKSATATSAFTEEQKKNLVQCVRVESAVDEDQIVLVLPGVFSLDVGGKMAVVADNAEVTMGEIVAVDSSKVTLKLANTLQKQHLISKGASVGLVAE
jgi:hypothetical protein